jgi:hypothetical protein
MYDNKQKEQNPNALHGEKINFDYWNQDLHGHCLKSTHVTIKLQKNYILNNIMSIPSNVPPSNRQS